MDADPPTALGHDVDTVADEQLAAAHGVLVSAVSGDSAPVITSALSLEGSGSRRWQLA